MVGVLLYLCGILCRQTLQTAMVASIFQEILIFYKCICNFYQIHLIINHREIVYLKMGWYAGYRKLIK